MYVDSSNLHTVQTKPSAIGRLLRIFPNGDRIPSLDGLRAVSILMVMLSHLTTTANFPIQNQTVKSYLYVGDLGVRVFFVISGFLITSLLLREMTQTNGVNLARFYFRRTLRIFPPFYAFLVVLIALKVTHVLVTTTGDVPLPYVSAFLYFKNYVSSDWYLGHAWSLSVEEQFYLLWPTILLVARRRAFWVAAAALVICPLAHLYHLQQHPEMFGIGYRFETVADSIAIGCLLAGFQTRLHGLEIYTRLQRSWWFILVPVAALVGDAASSRERIGPITYGIYGMLASFTVMNIAIVLCVDWCMRFHETVVGRVLNARPLVLIGVLSYSIYVWQQIFLDAYSALLPYPWNLLPILPVAFTSYVLIEQPSLRLRKRIEGRLFAPRSVTSNHVVAEPTLA